MSLLHTASHVEAIDLRNRLWKAGICGHLAGFNQFMPFRKGGGSRLKKVALLVPERDLAAAREVVEQDKRMVAMQHVEPELLKCPACAYDLRATSDRCPECGLNFTAVNIDDDA